MEWLSRKRIIIGAVVSCFVATTGVVLATIPAPTGVIYACYTKSTGTVRVIDQAVATCKQGETQLTWNQTGVQGPTGPQGPVGATGARGPSDGFMATQGADLFSPGGTKLVLGGTSAPIKSIPLPAGNYVVNANVTLGSLAFIECDLEGPTGSFGPSHIGTEVAKSVPAFAGTNSTAGITTAFSLTSAETVSLWCKNLDTTPGNGAQVQWATITAVQTETLTVQP